MDDTAVHHTSITLVCDCSINIWKCPDGWSNHIVYVIELSLEFLINWQLNVCLCVCTFYIPPASLFNRLQWCLQACLHVNIPWTLYVTLTGKCFAYCILVLIVMEMYSESINNIKLMCMERKLNLLSSLAEWRNWMATPKLVEWWSHKSLQIPLLRRSACTI